MRTRCRVYKPPRFPSRDSLSRKPSDRRRSCSRCRQSCDTVSDKIHRTNVLAIIEADLRRKRVKLSSIVSIKKKRKENEIIKKETARETFSFTVYGKEAWRRRAGLSSFRIYFSPYVVNANVVRQWTNYLLIAWWTRRSRCVPCTTSPDRYDSSPWHSSVSACAE